MDTTAYEHLRDEARKGSAEHIAYHRIVEALHSADKEARLHAAIERAQSGIRRCDAQNWNSREGYRGYYHTQITLYEQALNVVASEQSQEG